MELKTLKSKIFTHKIDENNYFIFNSASHTPAFIDKKGKYFLDLILKYKNIDPCKVNISKNDITDFNSFTSSLNEMNFLSVIEEEMTKKIPKKFNETKCSFYLHLTNNCNLKCTYCYNEFSRQEKKDLTLVQWMQIIDKTIDYAYEYVFTGGEPTLHKNFKEIVNYISQKNSSIKMNLLTNGCVDYSEHQFADVFSKLNQIRTSCDNISGNSHERIGFNKKIFIKNIEWLKENNLNSKVNITSVLGKDNYEDIIQVQKFCIDNNVLFFFSIQLPGDISEVNNMPDFKTFKKLSCNTCGFAYPEEKDVSVFFKTITCHAAFQTFSFDASGNCYPCQSFHFPEFILGNILTNTFEEIFYSNTSVMFRVTNNIQNIDKCSDCNLKYVCVGGCRAQSYSLYKNLLAFPEHLCKFYKYNTVNRLLKLNKNL